MLAFIFIISVFSGCTDKIETPDASTDNKNAESAAITTETEESSGSQSGTEESTAEETRTAVHNKRDSWDADYLLELQDRVEADYRNCGDVCRELGIIPNEEFLNRRFYNMNRLDMVQVHDDINRLTIRYLELELDDSLFLHAPEGGYESYEERNMCPAVESIIYASVNEKQERQSTDSLGKDKVPSPEVCIVIQTFKLYIGADWNSSYMWIKSLDPSKPAREYTHHRVFLFIRSQTGKTQEYTERQKDYQKKIVRVDKGDEITPIEFRFLFEDCMVYQTEYRSRLEPDGSFAFCTVNSINYYWSGVNGYSYFYKNFLLREVYGAPDENGRYDLSQKNKLVIRKLSDRYPGEEWSHPKPDVFEVG